MSRPTGITVLAVLDFIGAGLLLLAGLIFLLLGGAFAAVPVIGALGAIAGVIFAIIGGLYIFLGIGTLGLKSWAWVTQIVLAGIIGGVSLIGVLFGEVSGLVQLAIAGLIIWYLLRSHVRAAFGRA